MDVSRFHAQSLGRTPTICLQLVPSILNQDTIYIYSNYLASIQNIRYWSPICARTVLSIRDKIGIHVKVLKFFHTANVSPSGIPGIPQNPWAKELTPGYAESLQDPPQYCSCADQLVPVTDSQSVNILTITPGYNCGQKLNWSLSSFYLLPFVSTREINNSCCER